MKTCVEVQSHIALYLDRELAAPEMLDVEAHLTECEACQRHFDLLSGTVEAVRGACPLYEVPQTSYDRAAALVGEWERRRRWKRWVPAGAMAAMLVIAAGVSWFASSGAGYETFAAKMHRDYEHGAFPLDVKSNQPKEVEQWLSPRVPFHLALPNYPEGGAKRYSMVGARLMQYHGENVAYLAYEMDHKPISLLIAASSKLQPAGTETYQSGGLTFYFSSEQGLRIIAWKDRGLTYAQVSDVNVEGAQSCVICHGAESERQKFERLKRRM